MQASPIQGSVLVTGGAGFIGSRVVRELLDAGRRVIVVDDYSSGSPEQLPEASPGLRVVEGDVGAFGVLERLVSREQPSCVVHLAARVGVRRVLADPEGCRDENLRGVRGLAAALKRMPVPARVLAASTSEVYRESSALLREGSPLRPLDGRGRWAYAASKRRAEEEIDQALASIAGEGAVHMRFFNVVGPGQRADQGMVLPTFVEQALAGDPITVHGDGAQVRTFAHVDDVARDIAALVLAREAPAGPLNLGGTARCTVRELAETVVRVAGSSSPIVTVNPRDTVSRRFEEVRHRVPCLARARALGLATDPRGLEAIVADTLARHARAGSPWRPMRPRRTGSVPCASPAS